MRDDERNGTDRERSRLARHVLFVFNGRANRRSEERMAIENDM